MLGNRMQCIPGDEVWQSLKNRILLENNFLLGDLEGQIEAFVEHYNHQRYHDSLNNVTPADAYFGRAKTIIRQRERIKRQTIEHRRLQRHKLFSIRFAQVARHVAGHARCRALQPNWYCELHERLRRRG